MATMSEKRPFSCPERQTELATLRVWPIAPSANTATLNT